MIKSDIKDDFLNATEKFAVQAFVDNDVQREAVKKVLLWELYQNGVLKKGDPANPLRNSFHGVAMTADDPTKIGQRVMAMAEGLNFIEGGFKQLLKYSKTEKVVDTEGNPAR